MTERTHPGQGEQVARLATTLRVDEDHYLRLSNSDDVEALYRTMQADQAHLAPHLGVSDSGSLDDLRRVSHQRQIQIEKGEWLQYRIVHGAGSIEDEIRGMVTIFDIDHEQKAGYLGYWVSQAAEGRGLAFAASRKIMEEAHRVYGLHRFRLKIAEDNVRSERLAARLGAQLTQAVVKEELDGTTKSYRVWEIIHD